jgi:uncharacterized protein with FMN-binding domain
MWELSLFDICVSLHHTHVSYKYYANNLKIKVTLPEGRNTNYSILKNRCNDFITSVFEDTVVSAQVDTTSGIQCKSRFAKFVVFSVLQ